jgi:hypothetical protein
MVFVKNQRILQEIGKMLRQPATKAALASV